MQRAKQAKVRGGFGPMDDAISGSLGTTNYHHDAAIGCEVNKNTQHSFWLVENGITGLPMDLLVME